jgi:hypothetical protein
MKFYGNGAVWDAENQKPLCTFVEGAIETEDARVIDKLVELGYACDPSMLPDQDSRGASDDTDHEPPDGPLPAPAPASELTKKQIMAILTEKGIAFSDRDNKTVLTELLEGGK